MATVPTLLIGLGGIGSSLVDTVYDRIPPERRDRILVHAFDTNINDIEHLEHLPRRQVTQTSTEWTVGQYLYYGDERIRTWFPDEIHLLHDKLLTEGAGQVRVVSRLAYRAAMDVGLLNKIQTQITPLFRSRDDGLVTSVRVMIVTTLAGGTGAGLFLQTALYLREYLAQQFGKTNVLIRGAFLLPDVLVLTQTLKQQEFDTVRANAYACLKELDAILTTLSDPDQARQPLELEYRPDGPTALTGKVPYDFVYLYDFENDQGGNLVHLGNYLEQAAQTIFLQLFTPMAAGSFSIEDNEVRRLVEQHGENRYCGAGVARLVYPYDDIVEYCALKWATGDLNDQWLRLDQDFEEEYRQYERDLLVGVFREEPRLDERYTKLLQQYATAENPDPFFRHVYRSAHQIDKKQRLGEAKARLLLDGIEGEIRRVLEHDDDLLDAEARCSVDPKRLADRDHARGQVLDMEEALADLRQRIFEAVHEHKVALVNDIVARDCDRPGQALGGDHRLNTYLLGDAASNDEPLHPVAVRYVLYDLKLMLEDAVRTLADENGRLERSIQNYRLVFDNPETADVLEDPIDRLREGLQQPYWKRIIRNAFKEFTTTYEEKSRRQLQALRLYKSQKLKELVFSGVLAAVRDMLDDWEHFFGNLRKTRNRLLAELDRLIRAHETAGDPTVRYVMADADHKAALWDRVRLLVTRGAFPADLSRALYLAQYRRFCTQYREHRRLRRETATDTETLYRGSVLAWCRTQLLKQSELRLNVVEALRHEAEHASRNPAAHVADQITRVDNLARPWVPRLTKALNPTAFWGLHPESLAALADQAGSGHFKSRSHTIDDPAFSPFELIRYKTIYGLKAEDFPKLAVGAPGFDLQEGTYRAAYDRLIDALNASESSGRHNIITPHLDKRWHLPAYLPGLTKDDDAVAPIQRAFLLGLAYGLLRPVKKDRTRVWKYLGPTEQHELRLEGRPVEALPALLYQALFMEPTVVERILRDAERLRSEDFDKYRKSSSPRYHRFYKGLAGAEHLPDFPNVLDAVLRLPEGIRGDSPLRATALSLLRRLCDEIAAYYDAFYGSDRQVKAGRMAVRLIDSLWEKASAPDDADPEGASYQEWTAVLQDVRNRLTNRV